MIAPEFKEKLMSALQVAVGNLNSGDGPNEAVYKAATATDLNVEQTRRLCETFNTARTIYHFQAHPTEKDASFPLADQDEVLGLMYAATPKATTADDGLFDYSQYEQREVRAAAEDTQVNASAAGDPGSLYPTPPVELPSLDAQVQRAYTNIDTAHKLADEGESEAAQSEIIAGDKLARLAQVLTADADQAGDKYARLIRCYTGKTAYAPILRQLAAYVPARAVPSAIKLAAYGAIIHDRDLQACEAALTECRELYENAASLRAVSQQISKEANEFEQKFLAAIMPNEQASRESLFEGLFERLEQKQAAGGFSPFGSESVTVGEGDKKPGGDKPRQSGVADMAKVLNKGMATTSGGMGFFADSLERATTPRLIQENKKITERLRNQQREVLLQDLVLNDPYISEADPQMISGAYQQIMSIAPEVSTNKEVVRAILRQAMHSSAISPYDAASWAELEKTIREVQGTMPVRPGAPQQKG